MQLKRKHSFATFIFVGKVLLSNGDIADDLK